MKFSNENVKEVVSHTQTIMSIFQFPDNLNNHMISISSDGEILEWRESNNELIQTVNLKRPSLEFLQKNGHPKEKNPRIKISKLYLYNEKIFCGYEDGLINAWIQKREQLNKEEIEKEKDLCDNKGDESDCYKNVYYLDLILIGHKQQVIDLYYHPTKNHLISTSVDYSIKYWDLADGSTLFHFNLDTIAMKILPIKDKKSEYFLFLCKENVKITINTNMDPVSINSSNFPYNGINNILEYDQKLFLACYSPNVIVLNNQTLTKVTEIVDSDCNEIYNLAIWNNYLITLGNDKMIKFWDMKKAYKKDFYLEGSKDDASCLFLKGNYCYFGGYDRKIYKLNIKQESNTNYDRTRMIEEEKFSTAFNLALKAKSNKKGKNSAKGKKPASASKKPASGKKPDSAPKKENKQASKTVTKKKK